MNFKKLLTLSALLATAVSCTFAQCLDGSGSPTYIFFDDFGNFVSDDTYEWTDRYGVTHTEKIPEGHTIFAQSLGGNIEVPCVRAYNTESTGAMLKLPYVKDAGDNMQLYNHGLYAVAAHGAYPIGVENDNSGTTTGGMLQVDLLNDGSQDDFFEIDIPHICTGKEIAFQADFASLSDRPGCVEVQLLYGTTVLQSEYASFTSGLDSWKNINKNFIIDPSVVDGASEVTVTMKIRHDQSCVPGAMPVTRQYAIDNISFSVLCTPPDVTLTSNLTSGELLDLCVELPLVLEAQSSAVANQYYKDLSYLFQYTYTDPLTTDKEKITWHNLGEVQKNNTFGIAAPALHIAFAPLAGTNKHIYFRVLMGDESDLNNPSLWEPYDAFSPCRTMSYSAFPIEAALNCSSCTPLDFESTGVTFTADQGKLTGKKLELCEGEAAEIGIKEEVSGTDSDGIPYHGYIVSWSDGTKKICTDSDFEAPTIKVSYDDVVAAGAAGKKYKISFHDNYDPTQSTTPCDIEDEITVIANPKPTTQLINPTFCKGDGTEPTKDIIGYEIQWYTTVDTLTLVTEPTVAGLAESETFYYVVVDQATGCRSDVNEYDVTVNSAEKNPVFNGVMIEYLKSEIKGGTIRGLNAQNPSGPFSTVSTLPVGYKLHIGLITGETTETMPDVKSATLGADEGPNYPKPTVVEVNSSNDEYLWYYTYFESPEGCMSDTLPVGVVIKGAPSPKPKPASYCVNSGNVQTFDKYADVSVEDPTGTLKFYEADGTTEIISPSTEKPDVTIAGEHIYYVSQVSSTGAGESEKKRIVIKVYDVAPAVLSQPSAKYCYNSWSEVIDGVFSTSATSNYVVGSDDANASWEFFKNEPALKQPMAGAASTMRPSTSEAGETSYYGRVKYKLSAAEVCYGAHVEYPVEVVKVPDPVVNSAVTYQKSDGVNGFKKPSDQDPTAFIFDKGCTVIWYDENKSMISESDATPIYNKDLTSELETIYYVSQVNMNGCESDLVEVKIIVTMNMTSLSNVAANAVTITPNPASTKISVVAEGVVEKVEILNTVGKVVKVSGSKEINIADMHNGVYFVRTTIDGETSVHRLVINK